MFRSREFILVLIAIETLNLHTISRAGFLTKSKFDKWLDILTGVKTSSDEATDFSLDKINKSIRRWKEKSLDDYAKIPDKIKRIGYPNFQFCKTTLETLFEPELTRTRQLDSPGLRYFKHFAKLQYNLCLQDMEFKRATKAASKVASARWIAWYDAWVSDRLSSNDVKIAAKKMANYLKRFVPQIDVGSADEQLSKVDREIKKMIDEICPYVNYEALDESINRSNIDYFEQIRSKIGADPEPFFWSSSRAICSSKSLQDEFVKSVTNYMETQLNKIHMEDQNLDHISNSKTISELVYSGEANTIRAGNPIELLEYLAQLSVDEQQKASIEELLEIREIYADNRRCNSKYVLERQKLYESFRHNQVLGRYIGSMNALQFNVCDHKTRMAAADLTSSLGPQQLGRLNDLRELVKKNQDRKARTDALFIDLPFGFGKGAKELICRYNLMDFNFEMEDFDRDHNIIITIMNDDEVKADLTRVHRDKQLQQAKSDYNSVMSETCGNMLANLPVENSNFMKSLLTLEGSELLGELTISLLDYSSICFYEQNNGFYDVLRELKQWRKS